MPQDPRLGPPEDPGGSPADCSKKGLQWSLRVPLPCEPPRACALTLRFAAVGGTQCRRRVSDTLTSGPGAPSGVGGQVSRRSPSRVLGKYGLFLIPPQIARIGEKCVFKGENRGFRPIFCPKLGYSCLVALATVVRKDGPFRLPMKMRFAVLRTTTSGSAQKKEQDDRSVSK